MTLAEITTFVLDWLGSLEIQVQAVLDASLPNKQQHRAASRLVADRFHSAKIHIEDQLDKRDDNRAAESDGSNRACRD
jgi:hypothetical protein